MLIVSTTVDECMLILITVVSLLSRDFYLLHTQFWLQWPTINVIIATVVTNYCTVSVLL
jgi:hypothetical protein